MSLTDPPSPTDHELAKWRHQFEEMGPEEVRRQLDLGGPSGSAARRIAAAVWLRKQEQKAIAQRWWMIFWAVVAAGLAVVGLAVMIARP